MHGLPLHYENSSTIASSVEEVFSHLDSPDRIASHMTKSSWRMGGGTMKFDIDSQRGMRVGSRIRLSGRVFGIELSVDEVVTEREPPHRKIWQTVGQPRLLVIDQYQLGFEVRPDGNRRGSILRVFIDYSLPRKGIARWCGVFFGRYYARWCTNRMLRDAAAHFAAAIRLVNAN